MDGTDFEQDANHDFQSLFQKVKSGDRVASRQFVEEYTPVLLKVVRRFLHSRMRSRFDSIDFVQGVWASVFRNPAGVEQLESREAAALYLARMARNKVIDATRRSIYCKKNDLRRECQLDTLFEGHEGENELTDTRQLSPSDLVQLREEWLQLVDTQPAIFREISFLRSIGATFKEIAQKLGVHERTVRRFMRKLAAKMELR
jgi:RNA polymerase sigma factor (sigma-70 family)